jgi:hypothetical protein
MRHNFFKKFLATKSHSQAQLSALVVYQMTMAKAASSTNSEVAPHAAKGASTNTIPCRTSPLSLDDHHPTSFLMPLWSLEAAQRSVTQAISAATTSLPGGAAITPSREDQPRCWCLRPEIV